VTKTFLGVRVTEPLSLGRFIEILRRHWILLVVATVVGGVAAYGVAQVIPPTYTATTTLLVKGLPGTGVAANYEAAQFAVSRAKSYPSFIYSLPVMEGVRSDSDRELTVTELREDLKATNPTDTPLLVITAVGPSPEDARDMANSAARHLARFITQIETVSGRSPISVETAVQAGLPTEPTSPRTLLISALGAATGLAVGVLAALIHVYAWRGRSRKRSRSRAEGGWGWEDAADDQGTAAAGDESTQQRHDQPSAALDAAPAAGVGDAASGDVHHPESLRSGADAATVERSDDSRSADLTTSLGPDASAHTTEQPSRTASDAPDLPSPDREVVAIDEIPALSPSAAPEGANPDQHVGDGLVQRQPVEGDPDGSADETAKGSADAALEDVGLAQHGGKPEHP
jgi:capsular polysaccharide biosynthesis protein